ncbi:MAG: SDR family oxidoreductase [Acidobacteriota bacterium]|nr:SDR family oxidoreductase [Acidobacteriota bacterium]
MKIFIIGGGGMLGHKLVQSWRDKFEVWTSLRSGIADYEKFNIFDPKKTYENINVKNTEQIEEIIGEVKPRVIVNAVGIIKQLPESKDIVNTLEINSIFPHLLKEIAEKFDSRLINISTDCVFSGSKGNYNEEDVPDAADLYGKSKNLGEVTGKGCLTLRTSIIGRELLTKHSLAEWFFASDGGKVKGFKKAVFSGFPTIVLADILSELIENHKRLEGLYHLSGGAIDKFSLLNLLKNAYKLNVEIEPDDDFCIDRSLDSTKFRAATGFRPASWTEMIDLMAKDQTSY